MADKADSEEHLGEEATAGIPTWGPESKGIPERGWEDAGRKGRETRIEGAATPVPEAGTETSPTKGTGGEPEVGDTVRQSDTSKVA